MKGFDAEFSSLDHYIRVITDRIWEGRRIDDIRRYYSEGCAVETPSSVSIGVAPVIDGTRATLLAFPDRRLLAEDIVISGDEDGGFLSSHRIASPMTHAGPGIFGAATGKAVFARTIADCVCINNRIVHEWLVRDQAAIARQTGRHERDLAQTWLDERGGFHKAAMPAPPEHYSSFIDTHPLAVAYAEVMQRLWTTRETSAVNVWHDPACIVAIPGGEMCVGQAALQTFWAGLLASLQQAELSIEHLVANEKVERVERVGRATTVAMRWRVRAQHKGAGRYGAPSGKPVELLAISHADFEHGRIVREWLLIDDVAVWMQILDAR